MFIYMGKTVAHGGRVGIDIIDNKFPTVGLMISVPWKIFGSYWPGYVALQTTLMVLGALLLGRAVGRAWSTGGHRHDAGRNGFSQPQRRRRWRIPARDVPGVFHACRRRVRTLGAAGRRSAMDSWSGSPPASR